MLAKGPRGPRGRMGEAASLSAAAKLAQLISVDDAARAEMAGLLPDNLQTQRPLRPDRSRGGNPMHWW